MVDLGGQAKASIIIKSSSISALSSVIAKGQRTRNGVFGYQTKHNVRRKQLKGTRRPSPVFFPSSKRQHTFELAYVPHENVNTGRFLL